MDANEVDMEESNNLVVDAEGNVGQEKPPATSETLNDQNHSATDSEEDDQSSSKITVAHQSTSQIGRKHQSLNGNAQEEQNPSRNALEVKNPSLSGEQNTQLHSNEAHQSESETEELAEEPNELNDLSADAGLNEMLENKNEGAYINSPNQLEPATPNSLVQYSSAKAIEQSSVNELNEAKMTEHDETGTPEEQAAFMKELESFYRERAMEFKPPKFYGQPLNCLKLWRAVISLGGYDRVTGSKLWRQVGESFHPPKTCTTVSWTFRIFYEKALLEYERHKCQSGELQLPIAALPEPSSVENEANGYQAPGSGRARRDAAARAMQGWHVQRLYGYGEVGEPIVKDKSFNNMPKREKNLKSIGSLKHKRQNEVEHSVKAARTESSKQLVTTVVDVGPPADWVKINVQETKDCFEVYALVPGLLREEVRVQSDPAGRLVITGQPEHSDNPWGITPFQKVVSLPARIDPLQTSAVVSLHGRLFVRVPFEQS
ncbi:hypothetical protein LguiA_003536 [Lonicera macranthoides]